MNLFITLLVQGLFFGFISGAIIGPFLTFLISQVVLQGWRRVFPLIFVPLVVDAPIIWAVVFVLGRVDEVVLHLISVLGGLFVLYLARGAWHNWLAGAGNNAADAGTLEEYSLRGLFLRGVAVNVFSPSPYVFWGTIGGVELTTGLAVSVWHGLAFLVTFYGTFIALMFLLIRLVDHLGALDPAFTRGMLLAAAILLVVLGFWLIGDGLLGLWLDRLQAVNG